MGKLDHEAPTRENVERPLFDSLKNVWMASLRASNVQSDDRAAIPADFIIVSEPPPTRVLP
jgi:hypothetical protein